MGTIQKSTDQSSTQIKDPRPVGDIIKEFFRGNSPLAENYRKFLASKDINAEKGDNEYE